MRIVVIGGSGFIGSCVVCRLRERGHEVLVANRGGWELNPPTGHDAAIHMFAMTAADAELFVRVMGPLCGRLIVASSGDVYRQYGILRGTEPGPRSPGPLREDAPLRSRLYTYDAMPAYDKIPVERIVMEVNPRNSIVRLPATWGPGDKRAHRIGTWLRRLQSAGEPLLLDEVHAAWRWTHGYVDNVAEAIALVATDPRAAGRIYNAGEQCTPTERERVEQIAAAYGWHGDIRTVPTNESPFDYRAHVVMDTKRLRSELGFTDLIDETAALDQAIEWERAVGYV